MRTIPTDTTFVLSAPLYNIPAGATGQITRLDSFHVALAFDEHEALVFDVEDTEPEVWAAITPAATSITTESQRKYFRRSFSSMFVTIPIATIGLHYACGGWIATLVGLFILGFSRDFVLKRIFTP
jgi:hypothetical protein